MTGATSDVLISRRPIWRLRIASDAPRYLLCAVSLAGILASARFAIAPPHASVMPAPDISDAKPDLAAEGYAVLFARSYLTWNAAEPGTGGRALQQFVGAGSEPDLGRELPATGEQRVEWAEVVQEREARVGVHVYTVAAQTDTSGLVYLAVEIERAPGGSVELAAYPAFVGPPALGSAPFQEGVRSVSDPSLRAVVGRALRNYLAGEPAELDADLTTGASVSLPEQGLSLTAVQRIAWDADGRSVLAIVQAQDKRGAQYTLAYELDVVQTQGRWEVSAVQMNPYS